MKKYLQNCVLCTNECASCFSATHERHVRRWPFETRFDLLCAFLVHSETSVEHLEHLKSFFSKNARYRNIIKTQEVWFVLIPVLFLGHLMRKTDLDWTCENCRLSDTGKISKQSPKRNRLRFFVLIAEEFWKTSRKWRHLCTVKEWTSVERSSTETLFNCEKRCFYRLRFQRFPIYVTLLFLTRTLAKRHSVLLFCPQWRKRASRAFELSYEKKEVICTTKKREDQGFYQTMQWFRPQINGLQCMIRTDHPIFQAKSQWIDFSNDSNDARVYLQDSSQAGKELYKAHGFSRKVNEKQQKKECEEKNLWGQISELQSIKDTWWGSRRH